MTDLIFRDDIGPYTGKGSNLDAPEVDSNFYVLDVRVKDIEDNLPTLVNIDHFEISGDQLYVHMTDTTVLGPYTVPGIAWLFKGDWLPSTVYLKYDVIMYNGVVYQVLYNHSSGLAFDPNDNDGLGHQYYGILLEIPGFSIPVGGTAGQLLMKTSYEDFVMAWTDPEDALEGIFPTFDEVANLITAATVGKQTIWVPAAAMIPQNTNGADRGELEMSINKNMVNTIDFDPSTQQYAQFEVAMPKGWDEGTVTFIPYWCHPTTTVDFGVTFELAGVSFGNAVTEDQPFGTPQESVDTGGTEDYLYIGPESAPITIGAVEGSLIQFRITRNISSYDDTMAVDARLRGIRLIYTTDTPIDD